ncbi:hypothetical protein NXS98_02775 [Fontisphaera persica]|uniref:tetratricopeptide repeat protein n=1 Tax=Fontisphaera persica TaxID=2974023 RepID=UPI0024C04725|nr:hypothetical protein [Fontisphaera persica]WCJ60067.1 hypothetical protein NXS98_02775 [Fontisphaera persica]
MNARTIIGTGLVLGGLWISSAQAAAPDLGTARRALKENQPEQAAAVLRELRSQRPTDPWLQYNEAVAAYAAKDYDRADQLWQELATRDLPPKLRDRVWVQIGNVSFRRGEPLEQTDPQTTLQLWEQSRESYRIYLVNQPKDKVVRHNLKVVELRLAQLHARLAADLLREARKQSRLENQIQLMQAALDHQRTAEHLDPQNSERQQQRQATERELAEKFTQKAERQEQRADATLAKSHPPSWERQQAMKELRKALSDFQEAKSLDPQNQQAAQGEQRVQEKLAQLLAMEGRQLQQEAQQMSQRNPDEAIDKYEQALEKYEESLELNRNNEMAQQGAEEVKEALENLHMQRGDQQAQEGERQQNRDLAQATQQMLSALHHYQEALEINPENTAAPPKIADLQRKLPALLNELGERERQRAAQEEAKSLESAIAHMEKAATSFQRSQEVQPENNEQARVGEEQARQELARLRQQLAARNPQKPDQQQKSEQRRQDQQESFWSLLHQVKDEDKQREYEQARRAPTEDYTPDQNRIFKNW